MADTATPSERNAEGLLVFHPKPSQPPPPATTGLIGWLRHNLFNNWAGTLTTFIGLYIIYSILAVAYHWGIETAVWDAATRRECLDQSQGACWAGVKVWFTRFIYGRYPDAAVWRVDLALVMFILWMAPVWFERVSAKLAVGLGAILVYPFFAGYMFLGGDRNWFMEIMVSVSATYFIAVWLHVISTYALGRGLGSMVIGVSGFADKHDRTHKYPLMATAFVGFIVVYLIVGGWHLEQITPNNWGGLFLTLVVSGIGIASALPSGIVLALGRRSKMPVVRVVCTAFIELFRSVPLITVLFMATTMFPLFLPEGMVFNKLASAIVAVCLFAAAYMAETVRGGLQSINKGQYEAAEALGLGYWQSMGLIIMPQALKLMIPNIVGSFIGLFKDTTLVSIIGLYDMLGMIKSVSQNPQWIGLHHEPLVTAAAIYFIGCYAMSRYSQHLERKLSAGERR